MAIPCRRKAVLVVVILQIASWTLQVTGLSSPTGSPIQTRKSTLYSKDGTHIIGSLVERRDLQVRVHEVWITGTSSSDKNNILHVQLPFVEQSESVGSSIWPPSLAAAILLCCSPTLPSALATRTILELGSGIGVGGLVAAALQNPPRSIALTDNDPELVERLQTHLESSNQLDNDAVEGPCELSARQLDWRDTAERTAGTTHESDNGDNSAVASSLYDVCMGFDVAYYYHLKAPLIATVRANLQPQNSFLWVMGQANREMQWQFYHHLRDGGYNQLVDQHEQPWPGDISMILFQLEMQFWVDAYLNFHCKFHQNKN